MTNKRNAEQQIAKRVRRLERANLALDTKQQIQDRTAKSQDKAKKKGEKANEKGEPGTGGDSELRYHISASKNNPMDIFSTIHDNKGDHAYHVCFLALCSR